MFLRDFVNKNITVNGKKKGVCIGIGISLKTFSIKYLLCSLTSMQKTDFAVSFSSLLNVGDEEISLNKLRSVLPNACVQLYPDLPCYFEDGVYVDNLEDIRFENGVALQIYTTGGFVFPANALLACADALLLRKKQPYPLGQPIPAHTLPMLKVKSSPLVTKRVLKDSIAKGKLIALTLSLAPFYQN